MYQRPFDHFQLKFLEFMFLLFVQKFIEIRRFRIEKVTRIHALNFEVNFPFLRNASMYKSVKRKRMQGFRHYQCIIWKYLPKHTNLPSSDSQKYPKSMLPFTSHRWKLRDIENVQPIPQALNGERETDKKAACLQFIMHTDSVFYALAFDSFSSEWSHQLCDGGKTCIARFTL